MNIETDMPQYDNTHGVDRQNGWQCNQHSDHDWEADSGNAGGWTDTGFACSYAAGVPKEVVVRVSHVNGDTGCGGNGCANYTDLYDNGTHHTLAVLTAAHRAIVRSLARRLGVIRCSPTSRRLAAQR